MKNNILYETDTKYSPIYWKTEYTSKYCPLQYRKKMSLTNKTQNAIKQNAIKQITIPFSK